jgi:hypothetical protein
MSRAATMKTFRFLLLLACLARPCIASSTINEMNRFSYGANIGWMDWRADGTNGVVVGEFVCSVGLVSGADRRLTASNTRISLPTISA